MSTTTTAATAPAANTAPMTRRRCVQFVEDRNSTNYFTTSVDNSTTTPEDQWVSQQEFEEVKRRMKRKVQEWKMKGYGVLLRNTFDNPHPTVQRNIDAYVQLDERDCVRGMERSLSCNLDQKVANMKRRCIKTVLSHQRLLKKNSQTVSASDMQEELAVVSRMQSRPSVQFARRLGKADEMAVRKEDSAAAHKLVEHLNNMTETQKPRPALGVSSGNANVRRRGGARPGRAARIA